MDSRVENGFNQELESALPFQLAGRANGKDGPHVLTNPNSTPWGKGKAREIIVID